MKEFTDTQSSSSAEKTTEGPGSKEKAIFYNPIHALTFQQTLMKRRDKVERQDNELSLYSVHFEHWNA